MLVLVLLELLVVLVMLLMLLVRLLVLVLVRDHTPRVLLSWLTSALRRRGHGARELHLPGHAGEREARWQPRRHTLWPGSGAGRHRAARQPAGRH
jgi:hypothetical protein